MGRWLDLISPITEWAGLRGDALRYRRAQLRIQQEIALDRLAEEVQAKMKNQQVLHPLPPKIIVPALEAASLEDPDSPLIGWWANLLVSGATVNEPRPFLIDLMAKLGVQESKLLEVLWNNFTTKKEDQHASRWRRGAGYIHGNISKVVGEVSTPYCDEWAIPLELAMPYEGKLNHYCSDILLEYEVEADVCDALKLLSINRDSVPVFHAHNRKLDLDIWGFTALGIEFMRACHST